ncbi:uncharacterized protein C14orf28-like [Exaiptasia diaphana]|uniref:Uncharacterized protein n=1 Tax=Exaiptasia diaphana TaxID=2652724 RepID=A0A913X9V7_EXADI|nr:uncharacterized protein C14orf28-like [Exaiptasia diaphana]
MIVMKLNSLQPQFNRINFWNNEYVLFIRHFNVLYGSKQLSRCSLPDCPKRDRMIVSNACPTWMDPNISLQETVLSWMQEKETTKCYERDIGAQYCSGQRQLHQRTFDGGSSHPVLIPVDTELMAEMDEILTMNKVPPHLEILGRTYKLRSITLISKEEQHYVCIFRYKGQWLFYDGRENDGWPRPLGANTSVPRQTYFISHLLYE